MSWRATDLAEDDARQQTSTSPSTSTGNTTNPIAEKSAPPVEVESATWSAAGDLDYLVKERQKWWGRVRRPDRCSGVCLRFWQVTPRPALRVSFTAGTVKGAVAGARGDDAARFYAAEAAKVIQAFFHAAALTGRTLDHVLLWVAHPTVASEPTEIVREHPHAAPYWHGLLQGALHGDDRTAGNTTTTVQQAMSLFFQDDIRRRCVPGDGCPATDLADLIGRGGTIYLLGREDPYASASPLITAVAEHVLDTALGLAGQSRWGRLCPPMLACLDELPSTAPQPTLRPRMANERALGVSFIYMPRKPGGSWPRSSGSRKPGRCLV